MRERDLEHAESEPVLVPAPGEPGIQEQEQYQVIEDEGGNQYLVLPQDPGAVADKSEDPGAGRE